MLRRRFIHSTRRYHSPKLIIKCIVLCSFGALNDVKLQWIKHFLPSLCCRGKQTVIIWIIRHFSGKSFISLFYSFVWLSLFIANNKEVIGETSSELSNAGFPDLISKSFSDETFLSFRSWAEIKINIFAVEMRKQTLITIFKSSLHNCFLFFLLVLF